MKFLLDGECSERLDFRLLMPTDFDDWLPLFYAENIHINLGLDINLSPYQLCELWFDKVFNRYEKDLGGMNVLIEKQSRKMVGQCGLLIQNIEGENYLEIGYSVLPEFENQGFATEAAIKCKNFGFANNFSDEIISIVHVNNIGSERVAIKNGMELKRKIENYRGNPVNIFSIQKDQWIINKNRIIN